MISRDEQQIVERLDRADGAQHAAQPRAVLDQRQSAQRLRKGQNRAEAKITGITPPALTLSGMCVDCPPIIAPPDHALGVLHRDAALAALHQYDEAPPPRPSSTRMMTQREARSTRRS